MNFHNKTREELLEKLLELQQENNDLKEYFEFIFNTSPDAAVITRLSDGKVIDVNDGFIKITGFTRKEILGTANDQNKLWKNSADRQIVVNELINKGICENFETEFLQKNGSSLIGLISAKTFMLQGNLHNLSITRDISEQKKVERNLIKSEEKYRALYLNMIDGSALHTLVYNQKGVPEDYLIVEVNPAFESQLGLSRESVINKTSKAAYGVDDPPYFEIYSRVALTGIPDFFETYFAPMDKYFSISVYCPFKGSFATIFENITERKQSENENKRTQKLLDDTQRIGKIGGWEFNMDTRELKWTKEMYNIHEIDSAFVPTVDQRVNYFTPESLSEIDKAVQNAIERGESYEIDSEIITAKGNRRIVKTIGKADLENRRVFGLFQDITEHKLAEQSLKESEEKYRNLFEKSPVGKFRTYIDWSKVLEINEKMSQILGFSKEEMIKNPSTFRFNKPKRRDELISLLNQTTSVDDFEAEFITKDGSVKTLLMSITSYPEKGILEGSIIDITDRKRIEAELKIKNEQLNELNATKDKFFSIIAHDLKSPFNGILGFSDILKDEARDLDIDSIVAYANIIHTTAKQTLRLLENLLDWARMQQNGFHFEPKTISLNYLIKNECEGLKYIAVHKNQ